VTIHSSFVTRPEVWFFEWF